MSVHVSTCECVRDKVCLCQQESRWVCGCVRGSVLYSILYMCGSMLIVYHISFPLLVSVVSTTAFVLLCISTYLYVISHCLSGVIFFPVSWSM